MTWPRSNDDVADAFCRWRDRQHRERESTTEQIAARAATATAGGDADERLRMARTAVYYFVPEDGDDEQQPNFFSIGRGAGKVRLGDVKKTFPLPGAYHFRFKKAYKGTFVWLDLQDDHDLVPRFEGQVVAKVSRLRAARPAPMLSSGAPRAMQVKQKSSSGDLLGLHSPPGHAAAEGSGFGSDEMMDLDWSSAPSPSPSPPPVGMPAVNPTRPTPASGALNGGQGRSASPVRKQKVQIPSDLSSAAKDFKL